MKKILTTIFAATIALCAIAAPKTYVALSPDGKLKVNVSEGKDIAYTLTYNETQLIAPSAISMTLDDGSIYGGKIKAKKALLKSVNETIKTVAYKKSTVADNYNELTLQFETFDLKFRVYNDGMAYRFISKAKSDFIVKSEKATFAFPADWKAYVPYSNGYLPTIEGQFMNSFENYYVHCPISQLDTKRIAFLPLVVEAPDSVKLCITEADLLDYPGMFFTREMGLTHSIA
jgi:alpha-glucosidase